MFTDKNPLQVLVDALNDANIWSEVISLKRNEILLLEGDMDNHLYYLMEGSVRIFMNDNGLEHTVRFGYQNELITALDSFMNDKPTQFTIQTLKSTKLKKLSKKLFLEFIDESEERTQLWMRILESFVQQQIEREFDLLTASPLRRYERVMNRSPRLFQEIPLKHIASYLRMAPETLSRIRNS